MTPLTRFAYDGLTLTWHQIKLLFLFEQLFVSREFQTLLLFYDNSTVDMAHMLLVRLADHQLQHHDLVAYNIDRHEPPPLPFAGYGSLFSHRSPPLVPASLAPCFARSVSVEIFSNHHSMRVNGYRMDVYLLQPDTKWIRVYLGEASYFYNFYRYVALIELVDGDQLRLSTFNFQRQQPLKLFSDSALTMYEQLFFDQRIDMLGSRIYMWGGMDVPNLYRAQAFDAHGRRVVGVAGMYAAIGSLIEAYFNTSITFTAKESGRAATGWRRRRPPPGAGDEEEHYVEYERLKRRVYRTTHVMPPAVDTDVGADCGGSSE